MARNPRQTRLTTGEEGGFSIHVVPVPDTATTGEDIGSRTVDQDRGPGRDRPCH